MIRSLLRKAELKQLAAFGAVGFASFLVYLMLVALSVKFGYGQVVGALVGFVGGTLVSFFGNCRFVFRVAPSGAAGYRFLITTLLGFILNVGLASILTWAGLHYVVMTLIIFIVVPGFNYLGHRFWTFGSRN